MNQPSRRPTEKMKTTGIGGALVVIALAVFGPQLGVELPAAWMEAALPGALTIVGAFAAGYFRREKPEHPAPNRADPDQR